MLQIGGHKEIFSQNTIVYSVFSVFVRKVKNLESQN